MSDDLRLFRLINGQVLSVGLYRDTFSNQPYYCFGIRTQRHGQIASYVTDPNPRIFLTHGDKYDDPGTVKMQATGFFVYLSMAQAKQLGDFLGVAITGETP